MAPREIRGTKPARLVDHRADAVPQLLPAWFLFRSGLIRTVRFAFLHRSAASGGSSPLTGACPAADLFPLWTAWTASGRSRGRWLIWRRVMMRCKELTRAT